jgi:hypothetical protein
MIASERAEIPPLPRSTFTQRFREVVRNPVEKLDLRFVTSVEDPNGVGYTERSFVVENGVLGAQPA